jgi:hypothetical protein
MLVISSSVCPWIWGPTLEWSKRYLTLGGSGLIGKHWIRLESLAMSKYYILLQKNHKLWMQQIAKDRSKLECLSLAGLCRQVLCLWVRPGANTRVEHLKGISPGEAPALL